MQTLAGPSLVISMSVCVRARAPCMSMDVSRMLEMRVSNWALRNPGEGFYSNRYVLLVYVEYWYWFWYWQVYRGARGLAARCLAYKVGVSPHLIADFTAF